MQLTRTRATELLTVGEVASALRVDRSTVYRAIGCGTLPAYRVGRGPRAPLRVRRQDLTEVLHPTREDNP